MIQPVFDILSIETGESTFNVVLATNQDSQIFEGHFPGEPVVPGACMLQLVKDVLSQNLSLRLKLLKADNIKFLGLVQPGNGQLNLQISYQIVESEIKMTAILRATETASMKFQGTFVKI